MKRHGYFTVDFALAYGAAILAMAVMAIYLERALRGGFIASVRDLGGEQFDPRRPYHDNQQLGVPQEPMREFTSGVVVFSSPAAPLLGGTSQDSLVGPDSDGDELPSIPGGPVPREAAGAQTETTSNWITTHDAEFNATR